MQNSYQKIVNTTLLLAAICCSGLFVRADDATPARVVILNTNSLVRVFNVMKTPVVRTSAGELKIQPNINTKDQAPLEEYLSPLPAADWFQPEFDDSTWEVQQSIVEVPLPWGTDNTYKASANAVIHLRWGFDVADPASVKTLAINATYVGGLVAYLNGKEIKRVDLPAGELSPDTLAAHYPDDLTVMPDGNIIQANYPGNPLKPEQIERLKLRPRELPSFEIPPKLLRKGHNVLAIAVHRAPVNEGAVNAKRTREGAMGTRPGFYAYAALQNIELSANPDAKAAANTARPDGLQVWPVMPYATQSRSNYDPAPASGPRKPLVFFGTRNGVFSGRLAIASKEAAEDLKISMSALTAAKGGAIIPADSVLLRHAAPAEKGKTHRMREDRFDALSPNLPNALQPLKLRTESVAMAALWLTVRVPENTVPGLYKGEINISANGIDPIKVPVEFTVYGWRMPDPAKWHLNNFGQHSDDSVAMHYEVPRWSDDHFRLMGTSLALMKELNSKQAIVNLAINFYGGNKGEFSSSNAESMVRWIKQSDGSFKYDFTIFEKYLDMVDKTIGKPTLLRINCFNETTKKDGQLNGAGFKVSLLDPATGEVTPMETPLSGTPEALAFWKPVLDEVRKRVEKRNWWDVTALGWNSYCYYPIPEVVDMAHAIWPDGVWSYTAHNGGRGISFYGTDKKKTQMKLLHADTVWNQGKLRQRGFIELLKPHYGYWCWTWRTQMREHFELVRYRLVGEDEILKGQDGVSDFGVDFYPVKNDRGRFFAIGNGRGTGGPNSSTLALLAPGPIEVGSMPTERFEMLREGMQIAEAVLALQIALDTKELPDATKDRINAFLDRRGEFYINSWSSGRYELDRELFALVSEIWEADK